MRPHVAHAAGYVLDVVPVGDGYAVLSSAGLEILDASLTRRALIEGKSESKLLVLGNDRFVAYGDRSELYEGKLWGAMSKVDVDGLVRGVARTLTGYHAFTTDNVIVDHEGVKTRVVPERRCDHGGCAWRDGSATAGYDGLAVLAPDGTIMRTIDASLWQRPVVLADAIAVGQSNGVALFDGERLVAEIPGRVSSPDSLVPFGDGVLIVSTDDDARQTVVGFWGPDGTERWQIELDGHMQEPVVFGDRFAIASYATGAWIYDANGNNVDIIPTPRMVQDMKPFGRGIAIELRDGFDVLWWQPGAALVRLPHDAQPARLWSVPAGLVTSEGDVMFLWRPDVDGPAWEPVSTQLPLNKLVVIGGTPLKLTSAGRFALRAETTNGRALRIAPDAPYRELTSRDEAVKVVERLIGRTFDGPLPDLETNLNQLPLAETVDLWGRSLFARESLPEDIRFKVAMARGSAFDELALVLGTTPRTLVAAVKARKLKLEPPRPVAKGYEYLGTFTTTGDLSVADPCQIGRKQNSSFPLAVKVEGHAGVWHAFATSGQGTDKDRTGEFVAIHDDGFDTYAIDPIGSIGVDSGTAGVFDKKCPKREGEVALDEGTYSALGAFVSSGYGDGFYPVYAGKAKGRVAKIRIHFIGDEPDVDRSVAKVTTAAKPYNAKAVFAMGDTIEHVKFGTGSVIRVGGDGKIDVRFADGDRTLVHAKK